MDRDPGRTSIPAIPPPAGFTERRRSFRRAEDRAVHEERALLARAVDVLAGPGDAGGRVTDLLVLVARVVGARRAALLTPVPVRRILVTAPPGDEAAARSLAAWLDARSDDPPAVRAARGPAEVLVLHQRRGGPVATHPAAGRAAGRLPAGAGPADPAGRYLRLDIAGSAAELAVELREPSDARAVAARLPSATLRHVVAALAAASAGVEADRELAELRARERERERFVAVVAHELRTPLAGLGGYLDLLAAGAVDDPEVAHEFVERGRGIVERLGALVGDLLEMSRLEAGSLRLEIEAVSLAEACERAIATVAPLAAERSIRLVADLPPRLRTARADRRRLEQVIANLAGNACKFAPEGGNLEVAARVADRVAIAVVRDDGPGMERADRERIFVPFARLAGHERIPGTGLGLAISRDLARAMGGDLAVASVPGCGSAFILGLPAAPDVGRPAVAAALRAAVEAEELALEERAVLRALRAGATPSLRAAARSRPDVGGKSTRPAERAVAPGDEATDAA
jgi:signal transduction histidine kinase